MVCADSEVFQPPDKPAVWAYCNYRKLHDGIEDAQLLSEEDVRRREPNLEQEAKFAIYNPSAGSVSVDTASALVWKSRLPAAGESGISIRFLTDSKIIHISFMKCGARYDI